MSLRARVLVVLVAVAAAVAVVVDVVTFLALRTFLVERVDQQLAAARGPVVRALSDDPRAAVRLRDLGTFTPGLYVEVRNAFGVPVASGAVRRPTERAPRPNLPERLDVPDVPALAPDATGRALTVGSEGDGPRYRVGVWRLGRTGNAVVLALPLTEVDATLRRLLAVEAVVTIAALGVGVLVARWLVRLGLSPLDDIASTANAIAGGDLTRRVEHDDDRTEVGRLGAALNAMLGQIEESFAHRRASEERLRRFVADASHELRTPLTSIRAYAELFDRGAASRPEDLGRLLHGIEVEAARMGVLVDDLLLLARLDQGRPLDRQPVDLGALAGEAVDAARAVDPGRPLRLRVEGSVEVVGDRARLRQVIDNLLANVRSHTPAGTPAEVRVTAADGWAVLAVVDEGPGLSEEERARVFERFYRGDPSRAREAGGAGLGLAIVAAIVAAHGGRAVAGSGADTGAVFSVELPLLAEEASPHQV